MIQSKVRIEMDGRRLLCALGINNEVDMRYLSVMHRPFSFPTMIMASWVLQGKY